MKLLELLQGLEAAVVKGDSDREISGLTQDSRQIVSGMLFFGVKGYKQDGNLFAQEALERGAAAVVLENEEMPSELRCAEHQCILVAKDVRRLMAACAARFYQYPNTHMTMVAVTGTKGKTTVASMIYTILQAAGEKAGMIGTLGSFFPDGTVSKQSVNTTPDSIRMWENLQLMQQKGAAYVVMEVSSQGLKEQRVSGIEFDYGIFTNLSVDHIGPGEHKNFAEYKACKQMLFTQCKNGIYNIADSHSRDMMQTKNSYTYRLIQEPEKQGEQADLVGRIRERDNLESSDCVDSAVKNEFCTEGVVNASFMLSIPGQFSVENAMAAILCTKLIGIPLEAIQQGLQQCRVKGRMELVPLQLPFQVMIDYAHNARSLKKVLETMRPVCRGRLIALFGCGGNRSKTRRLEMGRISGELADLTVITEDNSREEPPEQILADIVTGIRETEGAFIVIPDRKEAIAHCLRISRKGDLVLLLGKGHETYQEKEGVRTAFDERVIVQKLAAESHMN